MNGERRTVMLRGTKLDYVAHSVRTPDGLDIAAQDWGIAGRGQDILFLHGFSQSHLCWAKQLTGPLNDKYRLVTYDLRGHGGSDKPLDPDFYRSAGRWADEVDAIITQLELVQPVLVAWSYAGRVMLDYLLERGTTGLSGLVFVAATSSADPSLLGPETPVLRSMTDPDFLTALTATERLLDICTAVPLPPPERSLMLAYNMAVPAAVRRAMVGRPAPYGALLASIDLPVLAIHGSRDLINLPAMATHTQSSCRNANAIIYDDVGHMPFWEQPDRFDRDLAAFVDQVVTESAFLAAR